MTIRTTKLGGSDWADGQILSAADLNDTIVEGAMRQARTPIDTTERTLVMSTSWALISGTTSTLTPSSGVDNILRGLRVELDYKIGAATQSRYRIKMVNNTTTGISYFYVTADANGLGWITTNVTVYNSSDQSIFVSNVIGTTSFGGLNIITTNYLGGSSYTFSIEAIASSGTPTAYVDNLRYTVYYDRLLAAVATEWS